MPESSQNERSRLEEEELASGGREEKEAISILSILLRDRWLFIAVFLLLTISYHAPAWYCGRYHNLNSILKNIGIAGNISVFGAFTAVVIYESYRKIKKVVRRIRRWISDYFDKRKKQRDVRKYMADHDLTIEDIKLAAEAKSANADTNQNPPE